MTAANWLHEPRITRLGSVQLALVPSTTGTGTREGVEDDGAGPSTGVDGGAALGSASEVEFGPTAMGVEACGAAVPPPPQAVMATSAAVMMSDRPSGVDVMGVCIVRPVVVVSAVRRLDRETCRAKRCGEPVG